MRNRMTLFGLAILSAACAAPDASTNPPASATDPSQATEALAGTWTTGETTCEAQHAAVVAAGFSEEQMTAGGWDPTCATDSPHGRAFTIRFIGGDLIVFGDDTVGWEGRYRIVDEDTFEAGDAEAGYYITYDYDIDGDTLTIDMVEDDYPATSDAELQGELIAQTVIYETAPFTRDE